MHYSWHENPKEIMTQKCYDVLKNAILSAIANDKIRRVERKPKKKKVAADIFKRKKYNCKVSISILLIILVNAVPRT